MKISKTYRLSPESLKRIEDVRSTAFVVFNGKEYPRFISDTEVIEKAIEELFEKLCN